MCVCEVLAVQQSRLKHIHHMNKTDKKFTVSVQLERLNLPARHGLQTITVALPEHSTARQRFYHERTRKWPGIENERVQYQTSHQKHSSVKCFKRVLLLFTLDN